MTPDYWNEATAHLTQSCPTMGGIIAGYPGELLKGRGDAFYTLARSVAGQQISVKAADAVWGRLEASFAIKPKTILAASEEALRACGLSGQKVKYLRNLSEFFFNQKIKPGFWDEMSDTEVIHHLTQIKGIGVWTVEMFLIFHLCRPDVFPVADIGLQKAIIRHYPRVKTPTPENLWKISRKWRPYRSVATWYLWRSLDPIPVEY